MKLWFGYKLITLAKNQSSITYRLCTYNFRNTHNLTNSCWLQNLKAVRSGHFLQQLWPRTPPAQPLEPNAMPCGLCPGGGMLVQLSAQNIQHSHSSHRHSTFQSYSNVQLQGFRQKARQSVSVTAECFCNLLLRWFT